MTLRTALISGLFMTSISAAAFAQGSTQTTSVSATAPVTKLDSIVVTATRTERRNLDALATVDVLDEADLDHAAPRGLSEAVKNLPNVHLQAGPRTNITQMNVRGLDDRRIVTKVDGVNRNFRGEYKGRTYMSPSVMKRVEVTKGAGSVLDGSGALAGTVQYITKDASDYLLDGQTQGATVEVLGATNGGMIGGNAAVYSANDKVDLLAFHETTTSGNISLGNEEELYFSELTTRQNMAKAGYQINEDTKVAATFTDYYDQGDAVSNPIRTNSLPGNYVTNRRAHAQNADVRVTHAPVDNDLINLTGIAAIGDTQVTEVVIQSGGFPTPPNGRRDVTTFEKRSAELYNTSNIETASLGHHAVTYGFEVAEDVQDGNRPRNTPASSSRAGLYPDAESRNYALYLQDEVEMGRFSVTPGVRYEGYKLQSSNSPAENDGEQIIGKLAAGYKINPTTQAFASVSQGYRAPLLTEAYSAGNIGGSATETLFLEANPNVKPEESTNFEVGVKSDVKPNLQPNDKLTLTGSVFYNDLKNLLERQSTRLVVIPGPTPDQRFFSYVNVPDAYTYGAELGAAYSTGTWFANVGVGYTRGENKTQNQPLLDIPPLKADLQLGRQGVTADGSTWRVAYTLEAAESQQRVPRNDVLAEASDKYAVHGLQGEFEPSWNIPGAKKTVLRASVANLFDTAYRPVTSFMNEAGLDVRTGLTMKF